MLCTLTQVKTRLGIGAFDTKDDAILLNTILNYSARFDQYCERKFERTEDVDYEFPAAYIMITPHYYPIESIETFAVKYNETDGFETVTDVDYQIVKSSGGVACTVAFLAPLGSGTTRARITYNGGYVTGFTRNSSTGEPENITAGQTPLPADVEMGCIEQCAYWYQNRGLLGVSGLTVEGGGKQFHRDLDLLPSVKKMLGNYRRIIL